MAAITQVGIGVRAIQIVKKQNSGRAPNVLAGSLISLFNPESTRNRPFSFGLRNFLYMVAPFAEADQGDYWPR
ncbi:hypothetical protein [Janthinobacterium rivuli]|uniref:hypothetical protein n=1 Tax=Janthinobacterium rivuli TaxID=2751478 RepID=UPI00383A8AA1